jgi:hypothetical protein
MSAPLPFIGADELREVTPLSLSGLSAATSHAANLRAGAGAGDGGLARARQHGLYARLSAERIDAKVREVAAAIAEDAPVRADDGGLPVHDTVAVRQLAEALCRLDDIGDYLQRRGREDEQGKPRPVLEYEGKLRGHVLDLLRELGITPAARVRLGLHLVRVQSASDGLLAGDLAASRQAWDRLAQRRDGS